MCALLYNPMQTQYESHTFIQCVGGLLLSHTFQIGYTCAPIGIISAALQSWK